MVSLLNAPSSRPSSTTTSFILRICFLTIQFLVVILHNISAAEEEDDNIIATTDDDDKDEASSSYTFRTAFLKSLPWGAVTALIYCYIFSAAFDNLVGPAANLVIIIWIITIVCCPPFVALVISLPLFFLAKGVYYWVIAPTITVIMSLLGVPCARKLCDIEIED